ncbi:MAG: hypothetical protein Kow0090_21210 [Myxococcota bacterium]
MKEKETGNGVPKPRKSKPETTRSRTISTKQMHKRFRIPEEDAALLSEMEDYRPKVRNDCKNGPRPCLFVRCKYHLYLDVNPVSGAIKINFPDTPPWEMNETCSLDVADRGGVTLEEVGEIMNLTRERVRQLEQSALEKLKLTIEE